VGAELWARALEMRRCHRRVSSREACPPRRPPRSGCSGHRAAGGGGNIAPEVEITPQRRGIRGFYGPRAVPGGA
jgi:hypothetical protein